MGWKGKSTQSIPTQQSRVGRDAKAGAEKLENCGVTNFGRKHVQVFGFRTSICTHPAGEHALPSRTPSTRESRVKQKFWQDPCSGIGGRVLLTIGHVICLIAQCRKPTGITPLGFQATTNIPKKATATEYSGSAFLALADVQFGVIPKRFGTVPRNLENFLKFKKIS